MGTKQKNDLNQYKYKMEHQRSYENTCFRIQIVVSEKRFCIVYLVAWERVSNVLELLHDSLSAGNFGIEKIYQRACETFLWPWIKRVVKNGIENCDVSLKRKDTNQKHRHLLTKWKPSYPFCQVSLNIMGQLPKSQGNNYILLIGH